MPRSDSAIAKRDLHLPHVMYVSGRGSVLAEEDGEISEPSGPTVMEAESEEVVEGA